MISKSPKDIYQTTSQNLQNKGLDIDKQTVEKFNLFLFGKINSYLTSFDHNELYVPQLGTWKFRRKKGEEYYNRMKNHKVGAVLQNNPEAQQKAITNYAAKLSRLLRLINLHEEMIQKKFAFKKIRDEFSANNKGITEKPIEDIRGPEE